MMFAYIVAVISAVALTSAYPTGAPTSACFDMIPGHAAEVQKGPAPYTITSAVTVSILFRELALKCSYLNAFISVWGEFLARP